MKKTFLAAVLLLLLYVFPIYSHAQESGISVFSQLPKISCNNTDDCKRKAVLGGVCKPGEACPVLCVNGECAVDLVCTTKNDCVKKAEAFGICQSGRACNTSCQSRRCDFSNFSAVSSSTPTPTPDSTNADDVAKRLNQSAACGHIGQSCCQEQRLPRARLKSPNIILKPVVFLINGLLGASDKIIDWVGKKLFNSISLKCVEGKPSDTANVAKCECYPIDTFSIAKLCSNIDNKKERSECIKCSKNGIWTAIGCFESDFSEFLTKNLLGWGIGLAGIISLLCIVYAAIKLQLSRGNPEKIKSTQEMLTSCIVGLLLIIFSVLILRVIGVDILRIPGFA